MFKKFKPLGDRVMIKRLEIEDTTAGGIIIPDAAKERAQTGEVIAVGAGRYDANGKIIPMNVKVGDKILLDKYGTQEINFNDEDYIIIKADDIVAVVQE